MTLLLNRWRQQTNPDYQACFGAGQTPAAEIFLQNTEILREIEAMTLLKTCRLSCNTAGITTINSLVKMLRLTMKEKTEYNKTEYSRSGIFNEEQWACLECSN